VIVDVVRMVVRGLAFGASLVALVIWLVELGVRSGSLSPLNGLVRGVRGASSPLVKRVERWLVRQGGVPSQAAGWLVVLTVAGSLAGLWLVDFVIGITGTMLGVALSGPRAWIAFTANMLFQAVMLALFIRVIGSWVGLSPYSRLGRVVGALTDWILDPIRSVLPPLGMIDLAPLVAYFLLQVARGALLRALY
jgi:YggT family protein